MFTTEKEKANIIFLKHYFNMLGMTKAVKWIDNAEFELLPAMFVICDYATISAKKDRLETARRILSEIKALWPKFDDDVWNRRTELYGEIIRGAKGLRCEFSFGDIGVWNSNIFMKVTALWGDITLNPDCADAYESAPVMIRSIFEVFEFCSIVMQSVLTEMTLLYNDFYDL